MMIWLLFAAASVFPLWLVWFACSLYSNGRTWQTIFLFTAVMGVLCVLGAYVHLPDTCGTLGQPESCGDPEYP